MDSESFITKIIKNIKLKPLNAEQVKKESIKADGDGSYASLKASIVKGEKEAGNANA